MMPRLNRTRFALLIAAIAVWGLLVVVAVPALIQAAYDQRSVGFLNEIISGRDVHSVTRYLSYWYKAAIALTIGVVILALLGVWIITRRERIRFWWLAFVDESPRIHTAGILAMAVAFGCAAGFMEAVLRLAHAIAGAPFGQGVEVLWMAPIAVAFATTVLALPLVFWRRRRGLSARFVVSVLTVMPVYSAVVALGLGIHRAAVLLLGLGVGYRFGGAIARRLLESRFVRRSAVAIGVTWVLAGIVFFTLGQPILERIRLARIGESASASPNVLVIILDTVRAASMSLYGYGRATTPRIDEFAERGVVFDRAISPSPWTLPAHASLFTGQWTHALSTDFDKSLDGTYPTLAELLNQRGYATAGFVANLVYTSSPSGLSRGFAVWRDRPINLANLVTGSGWTERPLEALRDRLGIHAKLLRKPAADLNAEFLAWLRKRPQRPFFAFLNYYDAHAPYLTHPPFDRRFTARRPRSWLKTGWDRAVTPEALQEVIDAYDSSLAYLDHHVGQLLDSLRAGGMLDNTIVVITSDHGEHLGERSILLHANSLYLPLLHVPLVVVYPQAVPANRRIPYPVTTRDLGATLLHLLGNRPEQTWPGKSIAPLWADAAGPGVDTIWSPEPILSDLTPNVFAHPDDPIRRGYMRSLLDGRWHYIRNGDGVEELYDIVADYREENNVAKTAAAGPMVGAIRERLDSLRGPGEGGPARNAIRGRDVAVAAPAAGGTR